MRKLNKNILWESSELDWIHSTGQNKILTINKLKELFKKNNVDVDWDIEYDRSADGHGEYNEYFGKFYYDRENPISYNESYFIELYEKENGHLFFQLYRYDEEDNYYHRDEVYSQIETSSKDPEKFWQTVGWLVLYQMGKIKPGYGEETFDVENTINESDDFDWVSGFTWYKEMLDNMLTDCKPLRVANFNIRNNQPYRSAGSPSIMFLSRCKEWWDYFGSLPLTDSGRGPAEWFNEDTYEAGDIGIVWNTGWVRNKTTPQLEDLKNGYTSAITTQWDYGIEKQLNGTGVSEAWFVVDENNRPVYNLIPNNVKGYAKIYEEEFFGDKLNESKEDGFDWVRNAPLNMNVCEAYYILKPGDEIIIGTIDNWEDNPNQWDDGLEDTQTFYNVKAKVLALDECNNIHRGNESDARTILVSIEEDGYYGFDDLWVGDFTGTLPSQCQRDNCMFLICDKNEPEYQIQLTKKSLNESKEDEFDWAREIPGTKEYGQRYRYFDINVCYRSFYDEETGEDECTEGGSYFIKIPVDVVPDIWDYTAEDWYVAGPGDEGLDVIEWSIENDKIDDEDIDMFQYVTEISKSEYCRAWGKWQDDDKELCGGYITESEFDWIRKQEPERVMKKSKKYVIDVRHLEPRPMKFSHDTTLTIQDILYKLHDLDYNVDHIPVEDVGYLYVEPTEADNNVGYWGDYHNWVRQSHWVDWTDDETKNPNFGGKYEWINVDEFMFLIDNDLISESKKTIIEAAGISFEARKWGETIYNEIVNNPNEKKRLIIDGYDHPEAFDGFPIDYVVIDFYDRLTGYGQEHSGYDKDGNYVVLLYIQPKLVQGQGGYDLRSVLNHEMKHAWEDYNRLSKGLPSIEQTKESQDLYNRDFILMLSDQNIRGPIKEILKYYYYLSDLEKSAYLENVYDQNKVYERVLRDIAGKDFNEFKDRFDLDINWHLMNTAYDIPFLKKFKSPTDFIDYSAEELRSKALKMIKKVNKMRYIHKK